MFIFTSHHAGKADIAPFLLFMAVFIPFLSTLFVSGTVPSITGEIIFPAPIVLAAVALPDPIYNHLPVALTIPAVKAEPSVNVKPLAPIAPKTVVAAVPIAVQKTTEARLVIVRIGVNAVIKETGYTSEGAMAVPDNRIDVGWFSPGTIPGELGSAVIGGHNAWDDGAGVFARLDQLIVGDVLSVVDKNGVSTSFVVREMRTYDPTDFGGDIFNSDGGIHLNLITCSGVFDPSTNTYTKRLVIFTDAA